MFFIFGFVLLMFGQNHSISTPLSWPYFCLQSISCRSEENQEGCSKAAGLLSSRGLVEPGRAATGTEGN